MVKHIPETDIQQIKRWENSGFIEDDILLLDKMNEVPIPREPRRMNFLLIALCTQGRAQYRMDTQEKLVSPGQMIIVSERHVIDNYMASPDLEGLCMILSKDFYHEVIQNVGDISSLFLFSKTHPVFTLRPKEVKTFKEYYNLVKRKINESDNHFRKDLIRTLLLAMFYDLSNVIYQAQQFNESHLTRGDLIFTKFIKLVESHCKEERRVGWYAQQLCITPKYLSELIKSASQRTPNEWIDNYVIMETRVLLKNTTKSIKEIAEELHFPNQSFLGKYFKEHVGISPSRYRKS
jgi:AraC-like DNA-binding protein